jgi:hypothetical protein
MAPRWIHELKQLTVASNLGRRSFLLHSAIACVYWYHFSTSPHADLKTTSKYVHLSKAHLAEAQKCIEHYRAVLEIAEAEARQTVVEAIQ